MTLTECILAALVAFPLLGFAEAALPLILDLIRRTSAR